MRSRIPRTVVVAVPLSHTSHVLPCARSERLARIAGARLKLAVSLIYASTKEIQRRTSPTFDSILAVLAPPMHVSLCLAFYFTVCFACGCFFPLLRLLDLEAPLRPFAEDGSKACAVIIALFEDAAGPCGL